MYVGEASLTSLGSWMMSPLVWVHSSISDLANVRMSTLPHDSAVFGGSEVFAARSKYLNNIFTNIGNMGKFYFLYPEKLQLVSIRDWPNA